MRADISLSPGLCVSSAGVVEGLHYAAYKNALCNSLYCPDHMVGNIESDHVGVSPTVKNWSCCWTSLFFWNVFAFSFSPAATPLCTEQLHKCKNGTGRTWYDNVCHSLVYIGIRAVRLIDFNTFEDPTCNSCSCSLKWVKWVHLDESRAQVLFEWDSKYNCVIKSAFFIQVWTTLCWSKLGSNSSTSAAAQVPLGPRLSIVEVSSAAAKKNNNFRLISHHLNVCCFYLLPPISPHGRSASLQVRFVWPAPAAWSTQQWWPSLQLQAPVKLWPSASCSSYWEPARTSRGARVPPANWCKVWQRQRPNRTTWVRKESLSRLWHVQSK